tara:strand:+ start:47 stop:367 length:321 start_codon:yes stop_codon:yes gene_type:complete
MTFVFGIEFEITVTVFIIFPFNELEFNSNKRLSEWLGAIGFFGQSAIVQPQLDLTFEIIKSLLPSFLKVIYLEIISPLTIVPRLKFNVENLILGRSKLDLLFLDGI